MLHPRAKSSLTLSQADCLATLRTREDIQIAPCASDNNLTAGHPALQSPVAWSRRRCCKYLLSRSCTSIAHSANACAPFLAFASSISCLVLWHLVLWHLTPRSQPYT